MARKFFRQVFTVELLVEETPVGADIDLVDLARYLDNGDGCSGKVDCTTLKELSPKEAAIVLIEHGKTPETLSLDIEGNDLKEGS